jgi:hypothetical protein
VNPAYVLGPALDRDTPGERYRPGFSSSELERAHVALGRTTQEMRGEGPLSDIWGRLPRPTTRGAPGGTGEHAWRSPAFLASPSRPRPRRINDV